MVTHILTLATERSLSGGKSNSEQPRVQVTDVLTSVGPRVGGRPRGDLTITLTMTKQQEAKPCVLRLKTIYSESLFIEKARFRELALNLASTAAQ